MKYDESNSIATITLDRPKRLNALTFEVYTELTALFRSLAQPSQVKTIIITGEGTAFCSGGDVEDIIGKLLDRDAMKLVEFTRLTCALIKNMRACPKPVIAAM